MVAVSNYKSGKDDSMTREMTHVARPIFCRIDRWRINDKFVTRTVECGGSLET